MNIHRTRTAAAVSIIVAAGLAVPALAQTEAEPSKTKMTNQVKVATLSLHRASELMGTIITNANGAELGSIDNLILERGTGKITHVVIQTGDILGFGGSRVAVPFSSFDYDGTDRRFMLNLTAEHIADMQEFSPEDWVELESSNWTEDLMRVIERDTSRANYMTDHYAITPTSELESKQLTGTITNVKRYDLPSGSEYVAIEVTTADAESIDTVVLGPSWYVMGLENAPMQGDEISVNAFKLERDTEHKLIAQSFDSHDSTVSLRDADGRSIWNPHASASLSEEGEIKQEDSANYPESNAVAPLIFATDVVGQEVWAYEDHSGEVQDVVIEANSGRLALMLLDPNENLLGIGDELKCVPFSIAYINDDAVRVAADTDLLSACEPLPEDITVINTKAQLAPMYRVFDVEVVGFVPRESKLGQ